jgi:hypothetical protein
MTAIRGRGGRRTRVGSAFCKCMDRAMADVSRGNEGGDNTTRMMKTTIGRSI